MIQYPELEKHFRKSWDLSWTVGAYTKEQIKPNTLCTNSIVYRNDREPNLPSSYYIKALFLSGVDRTDALYICEGGSTLVPICFKRVRTGYIGFIGDVNPSSETTEVIVDMCNARGSE